VIRRLWAIAVRNARRHKAQAIAAAAAVAVGTMVLSASLLAGQAAEGGIRQVAFDVLGETDEVVATDGDFYFPEEAAETFRDNVHERRPDLAVAPTAIHPTVARSEEGLSEPQALAIGFPPEEDGFGRFEPGQGAASLDERPLANERLADAIQVGPGDPVNLRYTPPLDPLVPEIHRYQGNITAAGSTPLPSDTPLPEEGREPVTERFGFEANASADRIVAVLGWGSPQNDTDLDVALEAPDGTVYANTNGTTGNPDSPAFLNATAQPGNWTAEVRTEAAAETPFRLVVLVLRPAFTLEELREGRQRLQQLGPAGDEVNRLAGSRQAQIDLGGVVTGEAKGGYTGEGALFLPLPRLQSLLDREGEVNQIRVSNPGGPREGLDATDEVMPVLEEALAETKDAYPDEPSVQALEVEPRKQEVVERAEQAGSEFTRFLTTLSSFTIVAGVLLVVNLFTMLGEERRVETSVMRALGTKRSHLVTSTTLEGFLYAIPGVPIGAVAGLGLAYVLVEAVNEFVIDPDGLPIPFVVDWSTVLVAALAGLLITMAAVLATGVRLSRLNVASGLQDRRDTGDDAYALAKVGAIVGTLVTLAYVPTGLYTPLVVGPSLLIASLAWRATRRYGERIARFAATAPIVPYGLWTIVAFQDVTPAEGPFLAPIRGVLLVVAGVVALINTPGLPTLLKAIARRAKQWAPASLVAAGYPTRKQLRTGLTASMFALVILVLIFFSTFFSVFEVEPDREAGGYDVYAETQVPIEDLEAWADENLDEDPSSLNQVQTHDEMPVARVVGGDVVTVDDREPNYQGPPIDVFYGTTEAFAEHNDYELVARNDSLDTDQAAYRLVNEDPDAAIVSRVYDLDKAGRLGVVDGGEQLTVDLGTRSANFTVQGAQSQRYLGGIFLEPDTVRNLFPAAGSGILIEAEPGTDPTELARQLETDFQEAGLDAEDIRAQATEIQQQNARFYTVLQVFLGIGLVIGVASLGIVTAKAALEREHELGVLRAMGIPAEHVTVSLVAEALLTAVLGIVPGLGIGLAVSYAGWLAFFADAGIAFTIPWTSIAILTAISLVATLASTIPPARKAARKDTAQAVRVRR
jgi:putative ABC transport system permease protein